MLASLNKKSGFEIFDFGIVLGRLILAGTFLGLLDLSRDLGGGVFKPNVSIFVLQCISFTVAICTMGTVHRRAFATHMGLTLFLKFLVTDKFL